MRVTELWRFPVKSMQGERLAQVEVESQGIRGDRAFALFDRDSGFGLTARRQPALLFAAAKYRPDGSVTITLPDGTTADDDEALSAWLGRPVTLRSAAEPGERVYENPADFEHDDDWEPFSGASGAFHDSGRANVSLLSTATLGAWPQRRFRANVILEGEGEDALVGSTVSVGEADLDVRMQITRCVMVTRPQPDGIDKDLTVLRTIHRERGSCLAIGAVVAGPGTVRVGDELHPRGEARPTATAPARSGR
ncbi:MAG: MOSC N-terminal beta barrel domain-containing protein [Actinomycetota bacterium]|nr:MOSC N-terminal beta barrel domain-containing protein [Actinomycetota bacterium]